MSLDLNRAAGSNKLSAAEATSSTSSTSDQASQKSAAFSAYQANDLLRAVEDYRAGLEQLTATSSSDSSSLKAQVFQLRDLAIAAQSQLQPAPSLTQALQATRSAPAQDVTQILSTLSAWLATPSASKNETLIDDIKNNQAAIKELAQNPDNRTFFSALEHDFFSKVGASLLKDVQSKAHLVSVENHILSTFLNPALAQLNQGGAPITMHWVSPNTINKTLWGQMMQAVGKIQGWPANFKTPALSQLPTNVKGFNWFLFEKGVVKGMESFAAAKNNPSLLNMAKSLSAALNSLFKAAQDMQHVSFRGTAQQRIYQNGVQISQHKLHDDISSFNRCLGQFQNLLGSDASTVVALNQTGQSELQSAMLNLTQYDQIASEILQSFKRMSRSVTQHFKDGS